MLHWSVGPGRGLLDSRSQEGELPIVEVYLVEFKG